MRGIFFFVSTLLYYGCSQNENRIENDHHSSSKSDVKYHLKESGAVTFDLDEKSTFKSGSVNYALIDSIEYYSFLNSVDNSINIFKLTSQAIFKKTKFEVEGPNGVGRLDIVQHLLVSLDSLLIYNINMGTLFLVDLDGKVKDKFTVFDFKNDSGNAFPEPSNSAPLIKLGNKIFISCTLHARLNDYKNYKNVLCYDISTRTASYVTPLPEIYSQAFWGAGFKYIPCLSSNGTEIVISYPIVSSIYKADLAGNIKSKSEVTSSFVDKMQPMKEDIRFGTQNDINQYNEEQKIYSFSNSDFSTIKYDPYNKLYFRKTYIRPPVDSVKMGNRIPDFSISVLTEDLDKLVEMRFDSEIYDLSMHFIGRDGYYIARRDLYNINDEQIVFTRFNTAISK
ncbi:MAG: DUF4221 family protein [Cyclobacteriaceae bacterium]